MIKPATATVRTELKPTALAEPANSIGAVEEALTGLTDPVPVGAWTCPSLIWVTGERVVVGA